MTLPFRLLVKPSVSLSSQSSTTTALKHALALSAQMSSTRHRLLPAGADGFRYHQQRPDQLRVKLSKSPTSCQTITKARTPRFRAQLFSTFFSGR